MYPPFYHCLNWACDRTMRSGETYCDECRGHSESFDAMFERPPSFFSTIDDINRAFLSERQAVALMQEFAA
jgi:hypothetical protein